ncbi:MAG TPA: GAF domain-containing protein, partial [Syntrophales bacterium]|nr:GAF domain-containing protein [Syntrophales bacterium]
MDTAKMMERLDISSITALSEKLNQRKKLLDITNQIHAAQNIKDILVEHKEGILALFNALLITIYVADKPRSELYSLYLAGSQLKEIRLPINNRSIAGFVANTGRGVSIADVYDKEELKKIDKTLFFDEAWDRQSGYRTAQVLALPVMHENTLMGVIQIVNRKGGGRFTDDERALLEEIAEVLGIALYNQHRVSSRRKTRFDYLVNHNLMKDADLEAAFTEARRSNEPIEEILMKRFRISRDDIGRSMEDFYRCRFIHYNAKHAIPEDLLKSLKREYLRRELWVPLEKGADGKIRVVVDDPNNILKKDMIENLLRTKSVEYCVSLKEDIIKFINHFYQT